MAATLTTRVAAGSLVCGAFIVVSFIVWRKIKKGKEDGESPKEDEKTKTESNGSDEQESEICYKDSEVQATGDVGNTVKDTGQKSSLGGGGAGELASVEGTNGNYVCENGVCRLVKPGLGSQASHSWSNPTFSSRNTNNGSQGAGNHGNNMISSTTNDESVADSLTKSLDEFFKNRGDDEAIIENDEETLEKVKAVEMEMNLKNSQDTSESNGKSSSASQYETAVKEMVSQPTATVQVSTKTGQGKQKSNSETSQNGEQTSQNGEQTSQNGEQTSKTQKSLPVASQCSAEPEIQADSAQPVSHQGKSVSSSERKPTESASALSLEQTTVSQQQSRPTTVPDQSASVSQDEKETQEEEKKFSSEDMSDAILISQNSPGMLSSDNAEVLVSLLTHPNTKMQMSALNGIKKSSTFVRNQNLFRTHGCIPKLSRLLQSQRMSLRRGEKTSKDVITSVNHTITNLSTNEENHKNMEDCVPTLVDLALEDETGETVCLSSLQALTNLSVTDQYHGHYTRLVQRLYDFLDTDQATIRIQALKVLVNLSCSVELVPNILAAKAPSCVFDILKQTTDEALLLRMTTFLANILQTVKDENLSVSSLPPDDKAPSPETMYAALYGMNSVGHLKSKVFLLCRHRNQEIRSQASRVYQCIAK